MKTTFFHALLEEAEKDERIFLVVGDIGFGAIEPFRERFPDRFLNVGVAEQNMIGIATGLALSGKIVFVYSISNFPTLRCLEQIRNDACYHKANVKVVAVGGGFSYGALGPSHHVTEDISILRSLPNMTVVAPGDPLEAEGATKALIQQEGACYLRLPRAEEPQVHPDGFQFELGKAAQVQDGEDLTLISTGAVLALAAEVTQALKESGVKARLLSMPTVKPIDEEAILKAASDTPAIVTLEEHSIIGGLGSAVSEILAESSGKKVAFQRLGLPSEFSSKVGDQDYLKEHYGLSKDKILESIKGLLKLV